MTYDIKDKNNKLYMKLQVLKYLSKFQMDIEFCRSSSGRSKLMNQMRQFIHTYKILLQDITRFERI